MELDATVRVLTDQEAVTKLRAFEGKYPQYLLDELLEADEATFPADVDYQDFEEWHTLWLLLQDQLQLTIQQILHQEGVPPERLSPGAMEQQDVGRETGLFLCNCFILHLCE